MFSAFYAVIFGGFPPSRSFFLFFFHSFVLRVLSGKEGVFFLGVGGGVFFGVFCVFFEGFYGVFFVFFPSFLCGGGVWAVWRIFSFFAAVLGCFFVFFRPFGRFSPLFFSFFFSAAGGYRFFIDFQPFGCVFFAFLCFFLFLPAPAGNLPPFFIFLIQIPF